jgi:hypothetical protein
MADEDEDFEDKEINYRKICRDIIKNLNEIKSNLGIFDKFKLPNYQKEELIELKEGLGKLNYSEYNNSIFLNLMNLSSKIEDFLKEIDSSLGILIKNMNNLSKDEERKICSYFKIEEINPELKKSSKEFNLTCFYISKLIKQIMDKYLGYYNEE